MKSSVIKTDSLGVVIGEIVWGLFSEDLESQTHKFVFGVSKHRFQTDNVRSLFRKLSLMVIL